MALADSAIDDRWHCWALAATTMPETAHDLSVHDLLRLLNEKLGLDYTKLREGPFPPAVSTSLLATEVSPSNNVVTWDVA